MKNHNHLEPIKNEDHGSNSKKKKKKKTKKKQKDQHTKSTDVNEGTIALTNQEENALVENEKSVKIKKKKKKNKKKQNEQHTQSMDANEGIFAFTNQSENTLVENEKSVKIQKNKKQKRNHSENDLKTQNLDQEHGNSEINQSECNENQEIQPSSGNDINGTSFNEDLGITMTENHEKEKRHRKSKKKKSKYKHQHEETAEQSFVQHKSAGDEVLLKED